MFALAHFRGITGPRVSITGEIILALKMNRDGARRGLHLQGSCRSRVLNTLPDPNRISFVIRRRHAEVQM
jgi:hypothetical protein